MGAGGSLVGGVWLVELVGMGGGEILTSIVGLCGWGLFGVAHGNGWRFRRVDGTSGASLTLKVSRFTFNFIFCNISFADYIFKGFAVRRLYNPPGIPIFYIILPLFTTNPSSVETAAHNLGSYKSACPF